MVFQGTLLVLLVVLSQPIQILVGSLLLGRPGPCCVSSSVGRSLLRFFQGPGPCYGQDSLLRSSRFASPLSTRDA